jgi:hypothetical protein
MRRLAVVLVGASSPVNRILVAVVAALTLVGCGNAEKPATPAGGGSSTTAVGSTEGSKLKTAEDVVNALKGAGLPIGEVEVYNATTDPNHQLGRPNGYIAKANFHDTRFELIRDSENHIDTASGGSVEVFADAAGARARAEYLATVTKSIPALTEYDYVQGTTLLRISNVATPEQAAAYETALKANFVG